MKKLKTKLAKLCLFCICVGVCSFVCCLVSMAATGSLDGLGSIAIGCVFGHIFQEILWD